MQILAPCQGSKHQPHEPITFAQDQDQPWRCPLCDVLDELDEMRQRLTRAEDTHAAA